MWGPSTIPGSLRGPVGAIVWGPSSRRFSVPESKGRKRDDYVPPADKSDRKPVKIGSSPWVAPTMVALFVIGLLWIVVFYIAGPDVPIMNTIGGAYNALVNVLIGFAFITAGFIVSTKWR